MFIKRLHVTSRWPYWCPKPSLWAISSILIQTFPIDGFHSRDLPSCGTQMTKAMTAMLVHITKEVHLNSFVGVHQHGRRDVT